ncbi:Ig-like domain-containing protein, partial [Lelliottia amnigena]
TPASVEVSFISALPDAAKSGLEATKDVALSDGTDAGTVTATFLDDAGAAVVNAPVTFTVTGSATLVAKTVNTDASGVAIAQVKDAVDETVTVGATLGGVATTPASVEVSFISALPDAAKSGLEATKDVALSDGTDAGTVTATFRDAAGAAVANAPVTFTVTGSATLVAKTVNTDASGVAVAQVKDAVAETVTVSATLGGVATTPASVEVNFISTLPDASQSSLEATKDVALSDGTDAGTVTATFRDAAGAAVANAPVTFTVTGSATLVAKTVNTDASGVAVAQVKDAVAETVTVSATLGGVATDPTSVEVNFMSGLPDATKSTLAMTTDNVLSDGAEANTVTATIKDMQGNAVANAPVTFTVTGSATLVAKTVNTDASGEAVAQVKDTVTEIVKVSATYLGATLQPEYVTVHFTDNEPWVRLTASTTSVDDAIFVEYSRGDGYNGEDLSLYCWSFVGEDCTPDTQVSGVAGIPARLLTEEMLGKVISLKIQLMNDATEIATLTKDMSMAIDTSTCTDNAGRECARVGSVPAGNKGEVYVTTPTVSDVKLSATTMAPGTNVTATYKYSVTGDGGADASLFSWKAVNGPIEAPGAFGAIASSGVIPPYTIKSGDVGKYIQLVVKAKDNKGNEGNSIVVATSMYTGGILTCPVNSLDCVAISAPADPVGMVTGSSKGTFKTVAGTARAAFAGTVYKNVPVQLTPPAGITLNSGVKITTTTSEIKVIEDSGKYWLWFKSLPSGKYTASAVYNDRSGNVITWNLPVLGYVYHRSTPDVGVAGVSLNDIWQDRNACTNNGDADVSSQITGSTPKEFWDAVSSSDFGVIDATSINSSSNQVWFRVAPTLTENAPVNHYGLPALTGYDFAADQLYRSDASTENNTASSNYKDETPLDGVNKPVGHMCWRRF